MQAEIFAILATLLLTVLCCTAQQMGANRALLPLFAIYVLCIPTPYPCPQFFHQTSCFHDDFLACETDVFEKPNRSLSRPLYSVLWDQDVRR